MELWPSISAWTNSDGTYGCAKAPDGNVDETGRRRLAQHEADIDVLHRELSALEGVSRHESVKRDIGDVAR